MSDEKAPEGWRSPRRWRAIRMRLGEREASWSAVALHRFSRALPGGLDQPDDFAEDWLVALDCVGLNSGLLLLVASCARC